MLERMRSVARRALRQRIWAAGAARRLVAGRRGLEIGGPSQLFARGGALALYRSLGSLDNCNFGSRTIWEGELAEGAPFAYDRSRPPGRQYIREATDLHGLADGSYGTVLSCHALEHSANPLRALAEWRRVLEPGGILVLVLPHRDGTFDRRRPITTLDHLIEDFRRGTGEDDLAHAAEVEALHDDPPGWDGPRDGLRAALMNNLQTRVMHQHVFDLALAAAVLDRAGFEVLRVEGARPFHAISLARKPAGGEPPDNRQWTGPEATYRRRSPFPTDRAR